MKVKKLFGRWKGFYQSKCSECSQNFYCRDKNELNCESCNYANTMLNQ